MIRRLRKRLAEAGTPIHIHPHLFRHNFLTEKALDGENPSLVRRWAGHRSYEMTDYYFGLAEAKLAAIKPKRSSRLKPPGLDLSSLTRGLSQRAVKYGQSASHVRPRQASADEALLKK